MEFDKSNVYTALNADELEKGDVVFVSDTMENLKKFKPKVVRVIESILPENYAGRFKADMCTWALAYLIARHDDPYKELKKAQAEGKEVWFRCDGAWHSNKDTTGWQFTDNLNNYSLTEPEKIITWKYLKLGDIVEYDNIQQLVTAIDPQPETSYHIHLSFSDWIEDNLLCKIRKLEGADE